MSRVRKRRNDLNCGQQMSVSNELKKGKSQSHIAKTHGIDPTSGSRIKSNH